MPASGLPSLPSFSSPSQPAARWHVLPLQTDPRQRPFSWEEKLRLCGGSTHSRCEPWQQSVTPPSPRGCSHGRLPQLHTVIRNCQEISSLRHSCCIHCPLLYNFRLFYLLFFETFYFVLENGWLANNVVTGIEGTDGVGKALNALPGSLNVSLHTRRNQCYLWGGNGLI